MTEEVLLRSADTRASHCRRHVVAWHGGDLQLFSRVRTLSMGTVHFRPNPPH